MKVRVENCADGGRRSEISAPLFSGVTAAIAASSPWIIENTEFSPGVRRMLALVGQKAAFEQGRRQMELLAGVSVTTKAVERIAEAIGADIETRQQRGLAQALQLNLPIRLGSPIPLLYVEMDGTGIPVVPKETEGRAGKQEGQPAHTREVKLGCVFTQTTVDEDGYPVRDEDSTTYLRGRY